MFLTYSACYQTAGMLPSTHLEYGVSVFCPCPIQTIILETKL